MIVGDPKAAGFINLTYPDLKGFDPFYAFAAKNGQIVRIRTVRRLVFVNPVTKELPVRRRIHVPLDQHPTIEG